MGSGVTTGGSGLRYAARAFRHRDYGIFWTGALVSNVGSWISNLTVPYVVFQWTHSSFWVGLGALSGLLPGVLLGPLGGTLADHFDRRKVLIVTQIGSAVAATLMWVIYIADIRSPEALMGCLVANSLFVGANRPAWSTFVNDLVPRADLASAVAMNSLQFNGARALGPAIAGVIIAGLGVGWSFFLNALSYLAVILAVCLVRVRSQVHAKGRRPAVMKQFAEAIRYVGEQPGIQVAIVLSVLIGLLANPIFTLTVVFAEDVFHIGPAALGFMNASLGVGCLLAVPLVAGGFSWLTLGKLNRVTVPAIGIALFLFAISPSVVTAMACLLVVGASFMAILSSSNTAVQMIVASSIRGRVISVRIVLFSGSMGIGPFVQGWIADAVGVRATVAGAGVVLLLAGTLLATLNRGRFLAHLDDPYDASRDAPPEPAEVDEAEVP